MAGDRDSQRDSQNQQRPNDFQDGKHFN
jgi:hypothetical protein